MSLAIPALWMSVAVVTGVVATAWTLAAAPVHAQQTRHAAISAQPAKAKSDRARRAEIAKLRKRLAGATQLNAAFWRDIRRLEQLGAGDARIAVVQHPGATMIYTYRNVANLAVAEDHVVLGPYDLVVAQQAMLRGDAPGSAAFATIPVNRDEWWPNGIIPFEIDDALETRAREEILGAIATYEERTPLRFRARTNQETFVRYVKQLECCGPFGHLASMTNHTGRRPGVNEVKMQTVEADGTLKARALLRFSALHETGHAIGLFHEHNRNDRDEFVQIDGDCVDPIYALSGNFSISTGSQSVGPYDFRSVMHYPSRRGQKGPFWDPQDCFNMVKRPEHRAPGDTTGEIFPNFDLSTHDINGLHHVYGRSGLSAATGDSYGFALLTHDFDRDGFDDLVVSAPGRAQRNGAVYLYKGTASGNVLWKVLTPGTSQAGQMFGAALAAGDFDGDSFHDLAVGAPLASVGGKHGAGKVFVFRIRGNRDSEQIEVITKPTADGAIEVMDRFGFALSGGRFFEPAIESGRPARTQLAIGAPGAREGNRGRVGRAWVVNNDLTQRFRPVRLQNNAAARFGQFGFALAKMKLAAGFSNDKLVVGAPGVTLGGCGAPRVYTTRASGADLETVHQISEPNAPAAAFCPQDPDLSDAIDAYPSLVWDATFGARLASGDFDGDGRADLAIAGAPKVFMFRGQLDGSFAHAKTAARADFGESGPEYSFGSAIAAADLNGDGRDDLLVGSPQASLEGMPGVGKVYAYRGCVPLSQLATSSTDFASVRPPSNALSIVRLCQSGLRRWFRVNQEDAQVVPSAFPGSPPTSVTVASNAANDRFGFALATHRHDGRDSPLFFVGSVDKGLRGEPRAGAVFIVAPSFPPGEPPYRTTAGFNQGFETRFDRD